ncbi:MAG TPA: hypothetical protein VHZ52_12980 [Acidobacteriaceae bacterium]|jgi:hypothetical protein|nr:hypothetical protein [Acidobacteriaceae bacterium]
MVTTAMALISDFGEEGVQMVGASGIFLFLSVSVIAVFSFISITVWAEARRKEREAYYKAESLRRVAEMPGDGAKYVVEMMREEERNRQLRARANEVRQIEGMKIGGLVLLGVGVGLMVMIGALSEKYSAGAVGLIPGLIGVALLVYALFLAPKPNRS